MNATAEALPFGNTVESSRSGVLDAMVHNMASRKGKLALAAIEGGAGLIGTSFVGGGAFESTIDYFKGYKTFAKIVEKHGGGLKGRVFAYPWAVANALRAVSKGVISVAGGPAAYVLVRSTENLVKKAVGIGSRENRGLAACAAMGGAAAGWITESIIGNVIPLSVGRGFGNMILTGITRWVPRYAAFKGEAWVAGEMARRSGFSKEQVQDIKASFFDGAMFYVSLNFINARYGEGLRDFGRRMIDHLSNHNPLTQLGEAVEVSLIPVSQAQETGEVKVTGQVEGTVPTLDTKNFNLDLGKNQELKQALVDFGKSVADDPALASLNEYISFVIKDGHLDQDELQTILEVLKEGSGATSVPDVEVPGFQGLLEGTYHSRSGFAGFSIRAFDGTKTFDIDNIAIKEGNGEFHKWKLIENLLAHLRGTGDIDEARVRNLLGLGVHAWTDGYDEHFKALSHGRASFLDILGRGAGYQEGDTGNRWNILRAGIVQGLGGSSDPGRIDLTDIINRLNLNNNEILFLVFHTANGTGAPLNGLIDQLATDIKAGSSSISEVEAHEIAKQAFYKFIHDLIQEKGDVVLADAGMRAGPDVVPGAQFSEKYLLTVILEKLGIREDGRALILGNSDPREALNAVLAAQAQIQALPNVPDNGKGVLGNILEEIANNDEEDLNEALQHAVCEAAIIAGLNGDQNLINENGGQLNQQQVGQVAIALEAIRTGKSPGEIYLTDSAFLGLSSEGEFKAESGEHFVFDWRITSVTGQRDVVGEAKGGGYNIFGIGGTVLILVSIAAMSRFLVKRFGKSRSIRKDKGRGVGILNVDGKVIQQDTQPEEVVRQAGNERQDERPQPEVRRAPEAVPKQRRIGELTPMKDEGWFSRMRSRVRRIGRKKKLEFWEDPDSREA